MCYVLPVLQIRKTILLAKTCSKLFNYSIITSFHLHKQTAAKSRTAVSGGSHSSKNGLAAYWAKVNATIACRKIEIYKQQIIQIESLCIAV